MIGLAAQFVGDHRRLAGQGRDDADLAALALHSLDQRAEVAVAGEQDEMIDVLGHLHHVDGEFDIHVALDLAPAGGVDEFLGRLGDDRVAVVVEPVDQRANRGVFLLFGQRGVVIGAEQIAFRLKLLQKLLVVYVEAERLRGRVKVGAINE